MRAQLQPNIEQASSDWRPRDIWRYLPAVAVVCHALVLASLGILTAKHLVVDGVMLLLVFAQRRSLELAWFVFPVWIHLITYNDLLPLALEYRNPVHVADLYEAERHWFGVSGSGGRITLPELFRAEHWQWADLFFTFVYLAEFLVLVPAAVWFYFRHRDRLACLTWSFLLLNLLANATWVIYPAAPPWYVEEYGLGPAVLDAASSAAGMQRADAWLGFPLVQTLYAQSKNVFGAMPSLHVAIPVLVVCAVAPLNRWAFAASFTFAALTAFAAVYFEHHYVLDVIAGTGYGVFAYYATVAVQKGIAALRRPACVPDAVEGKPSVDALAA